MKSAVCISVAFLVVAQAATVTVTPVQKVAALLGGMLEKGKKEKHQDQVEYAAFAQFCDDTSTKKTSDIKAAGQQIDMLTADISKYNANVVKISKEITGLDKDVANWNSDIKAASGVRKTERADYETTHEEYSESLDAMDRVVSVLKKQAHDRKQAGSFLQMPKKAVASLMGLSLIPAAAKNKIEAFLSTAESDVDEPQANAYEFQSHGIIAMLEKLQDKFSDERTTLQKEESNAKHAFSLLIQDLKAQVSQAGKDSGEKSGAKAQNLQSGASSKADLIDAKATKAEDVKFLSGLSTDCKTKASDFEQRQQLRSEEITAIEKAIAIITGDTVKKAAKRLPGLVQKQTSLGQLRADGQNPGQWKATLYLQEKAKHLNSRVLSSVANHLKADPFGKVKKMLKDLLFRLMEEANEESEHKGWCDAELGSNKQTRKGKTEEVEMLRAQIDETTATIAQLGVDVVELSKTVAELDTAMAQRTTLRQQEKEENTATTKDAQDAQTALAQAISVLKEFYAKASDATAAPAVAESFKGNGQSSTGVTAMLEVIESDFARLEAETAAAEATSQKSYDGFMTESKVDKASKSKSQEHKAAKKLNMAAALGSKENDLAETQQILDKALGYFDKLKPSCIDSGTSFEDRAARRKEEIESLKEAMKILNGEDMA